MIKLQQVSMTFDTNRILEKVDWMIPEGSVFGLVGPNGSGKSTLLRIISGVIKPTGGRAFVDEQSVYNNPNIKKTISFVSDDWYYLPNSSLKDMKAFYQSFYPDFSETIYSSLLQVFPIKEHAKINTFSKGMKRQASLILSLSIDPKIVLLDEAFDGLDPVMRLNLKRHIADLIIDKHLTVIVSSHNLRELEDICDNIALIDNKQIVLSDTIDSYRTQYHKFQLGFNETVDPSRFDFLKPLHIDGNGKIFTIILRGSSAEVNRGLAKLNPLIIDQLPLNLEELFVYEMEGRGYGKSI